VLEINYKEFHAMPIPDPPNPPTKERAAPNRQKLTQVIAERTRPPAQGAVTIWDVNLPGFGLRISAKGRRSWIAMYRVAGGKEVMETIGTMALLPSLADARDRARRSMDQARQDIHPVQARKQAQVAAAASAAEQAFTLDKLVEDFIRKHHRNSRASTIYAVRRLCRRALPYIGSYPVRQITKAQILAMVNNLADTRLNTWRGNSTAGALSEASGVLRHLRSCFRWAVDEDHIDADPTAGVRDPSGNKKRERERTLNEPEIIVLWKVCDEIGYPWGPLIQLLLLTGQREREVGDMPWHELDLERRVWSLPGERAKNGRAHDIHLSQLAMEVIGRIPLFAGQDCVFSVNGKKPVQSYADAKVRIDRRLAELLGSVTAWTYHDIRRSTATGMADLGIAHHVVDRVLNHVSGAISGIAAIYNRSQYLPERKAALDAWGRYVESLIGRGAGNVVPLRA
jgi:integrase